MSITHEIPGIYNSLDDVNRLSSDGSTFTINFETPLIIPDNAKHSYITVTTATVWFNTPNILIGENDKIKIDYFDGSILVSQTLTIQQGLYEVTTLSNAIQRELQNVGFPNNLIELIPDNSTGKVVIQYTLAATETVQIDFTISDSFRELLGFNSRLVPLIAATVTSFEDADNLATFNQIEYYIIHSDLVQRGLRINSKYNQAVAQIPIQNVNPGEQIITNPFNLPHVPSNELIGTVRKQIQFWLTDDKNQLINTQNEGWSVSLNIHYIM